MKRYIYTLFIGALLSLTSCVMDDPFVNGGMPTPTPNGNSGIQIIGAAEDFDFKQVGTRADDEGVADSYISEMTMLIFCKDGKMLQAFNAGKEPLPSSHINIRRSNPTFLINTSDYDGTGILASMEAGVTIKYYDNKAENNDNISACSIYIVANAYHLIGEDLEAGDIKTIADLEAALLEVDNLNMPYNEETGEYIGLPMIGCARDEETKEPTTFDLRYKTGNNNNNAVATIPLKKLYSKVSFSIQVNSKQLVTGQVPEFKLEDVEVYNVPSEVRMTYQEGNYKDNHGDKYLYLYSVEQPSPFSFAQNGMMPKDVVCRHSTSEDTDDVVSFHFYMPEHKVTPEYTETTYPDYPDNLPEDNRQYFKPKLIGEKIATFVRIYGDYTDHNGNILEVAYDIYLGQDNTDDFTIMRNQHLHNRLIINGITNHKDAYGGENTISIDHRVTMEAIGYDLSIERETLLDSHFEVRPLDIELQRGSSMTIVIDESDRSWVAMENDADANDDDHASTVFREGIRKYFTTGTTDLVKELNDTNRGSITIKHSNTSEKKEYFRIWFYIDENPHVYDLLLDEEKISESPNGNGSYNVNDNINETDKRSRIAKVYFYFAEEGVPDTTKDPNTILNFQQWNLWRVWSTDGSRFYDIEHEEEYLYNFASDDQYGPKQNGIPWGLEGVQLSNTHKSFTINETNSDWQDYINNDNNIIPKYDFYIEKHDSFAVDNGGEVREYPGQEFTEEIYEATKNNSDVNKKVNVLTMADQPKGAVEYCYNRNKRDDDGDVVKVEWYLPAADEMEDIIVGGYSSFKEFQDNFYWTSQPAYIRNIFYYEYQARVNGDKTIFAFDVYDDNPEYARATKLEHTENGLVPVLSGLNEVPKSGVDYTGTNEHNRGYFNVMYKWKRYYGGFLGLQLQKEENIIYESDPNRYEGGEEYNDSRDGKRYHVHLGHNEDDLKQVGYKDREESHRVRCVRRNFKSENNQ